MNDDKLSRAKALWDASLGKYQDMHTQLLQLIRAKDVSDEQLLQASRILADVHNDLVATQIALTATFPHVHPRTGRSLWEIGSYEATTTK